MDGYDRSDQRQQQELQAEQEAEIIALLSRVQERCGGATALAVASHLGMSNQWRQHTSERRL